MNNLIKIGYWQSNYEPELPDPYNYVDINWDSAERQRVIDYLKKSKSVNVYKGQSYCRFRCGERNMGNEDMSDGTYIYPSGYVHYLEEHDVKPPEEFIIHICNMTVGATNDK